MIRVLRFFYKGPGVVVTIVLVAISVAWLISHTQDRKRALEDKRQIQRPLGQIAPSDQVDKSQAPKEVILSDRRLEPGSVTGREFNSPQVLPASVPSQSAPLPTLVSFYAQVAPSPTQTPAPPPRPRAPDVWLPPSIFIPCILVNTVESSHINTPVVGEVTKDMYQKNNGVSRLIIPAGTLVSSLRNRVQLEIASKSRVLGFSFIQTGVSSESTELLVIAKRIPAISRSASKTAAPDCRAS